MKLPSIELEVSQLCWSEEKLSHVLKTDSDKLFEDLLTNKTFSKPIYLEILRWIFAWIGDWLGNPLVEN